MHDSVFSDAVSNNLTLIHISGSASNFMSMIMGTFPFGGTVAKFEYYGKYLCRMQALPPKTTTH